MLYAEKDSNEFKHYERYNEEVLVEKAVKTTIRLLYDKGIFDNYDNVNEVLKNFPLFEVNQRRRPDLEELNHVFGATK